MIEIFTYFRVDLNDLTSNDDSSFDRKYILSTGNYIHSWTNTFDLLGVDLNLEYEFEYIYFHLITVFKFLMKRNKRVKFTGKDF